MKKLGKLNINFEKLLNEEDLIMLRGGNVVVSCHCMCYTGDPIPSPVGLMAAINMADCIDSCHTINPSYGHTWNCLS